jgi:hypothetical protein
MVALGVTLLTLAAGPVPPPAVDLRPEFARRGLAVRNQGRRGSCQVFAFLGPLEYERGEVLSPQYLMWATNRACRLSLVEGFNPDRLVKGLDAHGVCRDADMPYVPRKEPVGDPPAGVTGTVRGGLVSIKHWSSPVGFTSAHLAAIRAELDAGRPVTVTLCWPFGVPDRDITDRQQFLIDRHIDGTSKDGHGVVLVGYGLGANIPGGGYFLLRNSWGPGFADAGHCRISFVFAAKYGTDAYRVTAR